MFRIFSVLSLFDTGRHFLNIPDTLPRNLLKSVSIRWLRMYITPIYLHFVCSTSAHSRRFYGRSLAQMKVAAKSQVGLFQTTSTLCSFFCTFKILWWSCQLIYKMAMEVRNTSRNTSWMHWKCPMAAEWSMSLQNSLTNGKRFTAKSLINLSVNCGVHISRSLVKLTFEAICRDFLLTGWVFALTHIRRPQHIHRPAFGTLRRVRWRCFLESVRFHISAFFIDDCIV